MKNPVNIRNKGTLKYYVSTFGGWGVLSPNADTADDGEGGRGVSDEMLTLGSRGKVGA